MADNNNDLQEAYKAYQAYKAYKAYKAQRNPAAPEKQSYVQTAIQNMGGANVANGNEPAQDMLNDPEGTKAQAKLGVGLAMGAATPAIEAGGLAGPAIRAVVNGGEAGLQKYFSNIVDNKSDPTEGVGGNALLGGLVSSGADAAGAGMSRLADKAMLRAVGLTKYLKGMGNKLADMGIWGTKEGMANSVSEKLAEKEGQLKDLVSGLQGNVSGKDMADAIMQKGQEGSQLVTRSGRTLNGLSGDLDQVKQAAGQFDPSVIGAEGPVEQLSPDDLLDLKRQGEMLGYTNSGSPATSTQAGIGRAIANKSRSSLADMSNDDTRKILGDEQALTLAQKSLGKPETLSKLPIGFGEISGAGVGRVLGGEPGAMLGLGINEASRFPLINSLFGQAMQKGANASSAVANPAVLQSLFGAGNASSSGQ